ncbi:leucyl aminopeptidase family protein [Angustibacter sp. McL0619]|uniref:leucyl aminopeptidase family protein n=1 Tax=Angustibacter sp. McL0619 TaxID=3415676 RepID=UPI003CF299E7
MRAPRIRPVAGRLAEVLAAGSPIDVLAVPVLTGADGARPSAAARQAGELLGFDLDQTLDLERVRGSAGEVTRVPWAPGPGSQPVQRVVLVGVDAGQPASVRLAAAALARAHRGQDRLVTTLGAGSAAATRAMAEGFVLGSYSPPRTGTGDGPRSPLRRVDVVGRVAPSELDRGLAVADATVLARDLAHTPSSVKSPAWLAGRARRAAAEVGLRCRVRDHRQLLADGFGGLLAVGGGAHRPPRLVELTYTPPELGPGTQHVVLVGKGITFDTGGVSLKPREAMVPMKTDMTGAGVVLAVLRACARLEVRVKVTGLLALAENTLGACAYRPGDVVRQYGGRTVEVRNTDAEGRLVMADALAYADAHLDPDVLVDIATLTGAATMGLGRGHAAMYTADERLAAALQQAGELGAERVWRMPLAEDYRSAIDSDVADICQIASVPGVGGGSIIAALFLREFVGERRWVHLDIAGPGRGDRDTGVSTRGGTGFGARLLLRWLETQS